MPNKAENLSTLQNNEKAKKTWATLNLTDEDNSTEDDYNITIERCKLFQKVLML